MINQTNNGVDESWVEEIDIGQTDRLTDYKRKGYMTMPQTKNAF